jgi:acyl-CoA thioesterase II
MSDAYFIGAAVQVHDVAGQTFGTKMAMAASLNHTIYFHRPEAVRADEWMCSERESPWAGNDRALVVQRIWSGEGTLVATCVQEVYFFCLLFPSTLPRLLVPFTLDC